MNDAIIPCVSNIRVFGVFVDSQLNWSYHINFICNKLSQCISMLRVCIRFFCLAMYVAMHYAFAQSYLIRHCIHVRY